MPIEQTIKKIIADIKKIDLHTMHFSPNSNFLEEINMDSFEVVKFIDKLDGIFNINFGAKSADFDSLKTWSLFLTNIQSEVASKEYIDDDK